MAYALEVDGLSLLIDGAWQVNRSLLRLMSGPAKKGENTSIPGLAGRLDNEHLADETPYDLELLVKGRNNHAGVPYADDVAGKILNLKYLRTRLAEPTGTFAAELTLPDASTLTGDVQVANWMVARDDGAVATVTFDLIVLQGVLT